MTQIHKLFKRAMDRYGVQGKQLAELAGITPNQLSEFRNGKKWLSQRNFEALLEGMDQLSPGAKKYFCELLAGEALEVNKEQDSNKRLIELVENANEDDIDALLLALGKKLKKNLNNQPISRNYSPDYESAIAI